MTPSLNQVRCNDTHGYWSLKEQNRQVWCAVLLCKAKRQYLLTVQVSRYCLLALQISVVPLVTQASQQTHTTVI